MAAAKTIPVFESPDQIKLGNAGMVTDIAPCKTFHKNYDIEHFCSNSGVFGGLMTLICKNFRFTHEFRLSPE